MKRNILLLILLICISSFGLISCRTHIEDDGGEYIPPREQTTFELDLSGYVANIGNATALGISKKSNTSFLPYSLNNKSDISANVFSANESNVKKNYIVMTTTKYDPNEPETNDNGLVKVSFSKIITENITTETTGEKLVIANNGIISISAIEGFKYSIYYNDSVIYNEVEDNDVYDIEERVGVIVLDNLIDGVEYTVRYKGIGIEKTITQEDIDGEIDKLYVTDEYTFLSFVPEGQSQRANDFELEYGPDNIATYDKYGYVSDSMRQSFIIDNATGYVYDLKKFPIDFINPGIIVSSGKYYEMQIKDTGELNFVQVVRNETLNVYNVFKDKYGNKYIQNDYLNAYDAENKTVYYTKTNYFLSFEGIAIHIDYTGQFNYDQMPSRFTTLEKVNADFTFSSITKNESYKIFYSPCNENSTHTTSYVIISHIENGYLYMYTQSSSNSYFRRISTTMLTRNDWEQYDHHYQEIKNYGISGERGDCLMSFPINFNTVLLWSDLSGTPKLYYGSVWGEDSVPDSNFNEDKMSILLENCSCVTDWDWAFDLDILKFRCTTFTETIFYKVVVDENGNPKVVNSETYIAPEKDIVSLQPINKR